MKLKFLTFGALLIVLFGADQLRANNVGQKIGDFKLPMIENSSMNYDVTKLKNRIVLINFWASWCQSCKGEMPYLEALAKEYQKYPFKVIAINLDRKQEMALAFIAKLKQDLGDTLTMTMLYDKEKTLFKQHPARGYPYTLLVKDGVIIEDYLGSFDAKSIKELKKRIKSLFN